MTRLASPARRLKRPYPTLLGQNVYVSCPRRIRSTEKPYALGDRRREVDGRKGELIVGKTYGIPRKNEGESITLLGQLAWVEGEGGA